MRSACGLSFGVLLYDMNFYGMEIDHIYNAIYFVTKSDILSVLCLLCSPRTVRRSFAGAQDDSPSTAFGPVTARKGILDRKHGKYERYRIVEYMYGMWL